MKYELPEPPFWPLADLAVAWGCSTSLLEVFAEHGTAGDRGNRLQIATHTLAGVEVRGVTSEEKARFEGTRAAQTPGSPGAASRERNSLLALVGMLAVLWNPEQRKHYALMGEIEQAARGSGIPVLRGRETNAGLLREALDLLIAHGWRRADGPREREIGSRPTGKPTLATENPNSDFQRSDERIASSS